MHSAQRDVSLTEKYRGSKCDACGQALLSLSSDWRLSMLGPPAWRNEKSLAIHYFHLARELRRG